MNEINNRKKALKFKNKMQKDIIKRHLANLEAISNSAKANLRNCLHTNDELRGNDLINQK